MMPSQPSDAWDAALAVAREGCETAALRRLAKACRSLAIAPSFDVADRDRLRAKLDVKIKDGGAVFNAGLKALGKIAARHPELAISDCPKILSASEGACAAHRLRFGPAFEASIEAYVTASNAPVDAYGRRWIILKSVAEKHPNALRLAAHICAKAKLPAVTDITDPLLSGAITAMLLSPPTVPRNGVPADATRC